MRVNEQGHALKINNKHNNCVFFAFLCAFSFVFAVLSFSKQAYAQNNNPELAEIEFNEQNNSEQALEIASKLIPDFFNVEQNTFPQDPKFFARFVELDRNNPNRFIVMTARDSLYYCTNYGCPIYVFFNKNNNQWVQVLSAQAHGIFYDVNSNDRLARNVITVSTNLAQTDLSVWLWNGMIYEEVSKK